jgi:hypothetical protein
MRISFSCCAVCIVSALFPFFSSALLAQDQSQKDLCNKHGLTQTECFALTKEFAAKHALAGESPVGLDPLSDIGPFVQQHAAAAYAAVVGGTLKTDAESLALQAVSTRAAVNQVGAGSTSGSGSTNLVSKPTTTDFISLASESGAFTDTVNSTSATVQVNANGLAKLFTKHPIFSMDTPSYARALQPLNFTVTLNVAQNSGSAAVPTSSGSLLSSILLPSNNASFSSVQMRYDVYRPNDPNTAAFKQKFVNALTSDQSAIDSDTAALATAIVSLLPAVTTSPEYTASHAIWIQSAAAAEAPATSNFESLIMAYITYKRDGYTAIETAPGYQNAILAMATGLNGIQDLANKAVTLARGTALATLTYTYSTPAQQSAQHQFGIVGSYLFQGGHQIVDPKTGKKVNDGARTFLSGAQFNANFGASLYADKPTAASNGVLRDLQASMEFDKPFGGTSADPRATWSVAGYGQYQYDPTFLNITAGNLAPGTNITLPSNAQVLLGTAGWLGVVQGKLAINLNKGLSIPIALKWSNRTELLDANDVRGQIGISYDLSALSSLISGKSQ